MLIEYIRSIPYGSVRMHGVTAKRHVAQFGWRYSFESYKLTAEASLPAEVEDVRSRAAALAGMAAEDLSEALVTEYGLGAGIGWHRDAPHFGVVAGLSLGGECRMRFQRGQGNDRLTAAAILPPRSIYLLTGEARNSWQHTIPPVRTLRGSITFRTVRPTLSIMMLITGASGRISHRTAELLAADGRRLRLMTRSPQCAPHLPGVETVRGDFAEPATLTNAFEGIRVALLVSGAGEPGKRAQLHRNAFHAAKDARVEHLVYLSLQGSAPDSKYPFSRDHYLSEQYLFETGLPCTVLRNAFYMDMFLEKFDADGVILGPAGDGRGAFVSREDVALTSVAVLRKPPGGVHDVTGPEALSVSDIARRLSSLVGRQLRYKVESADGAHDRLSRLEPLAWRVDLAASWFQAIAAGELQRTSDTVLRFTGRAPLTLEEYFRAFPLLLNRLQPEENRTC